MPVSDYVQILMRLHELAEISIKKVNEERAERDFRLDEYRKRIVSVFVEESEKYLDRLPKETREGAIVSLKDYGQRNREDIVSRIMRGDLPKDPKSI
jgi:hypothetical protein